MENILYREMKNFILLCTNEQLEKFKAQHLHQDFTTNIFDDIDNIDADLILPIYNELILLLRLSNYNGWLNRHETNLPKEPKEIAIIKVDSKHWELLVCDWIPFKKELQTNPNSKKYVDGYLGTAYTKKEPVIGFHAWNQNDSEFVWYKINPN